MQVRFARHTDRLDEVAAFYRDGIGLPETGRFRDHAGYAGVFLDLPGTAAHLELTTGGDLGAPAPHPETLLVLYLGDRSRVQEVVARVGPVETEPANPYWREHGITLADPDGCLVVLVPGAWTAP